MIRCNKCGRLFDDEECLAKIVEHCEFRDMVWHVESREIYQNTELERSAFVFEEVFNGCPDCLDDAYLATVTGDDLDKLMEERFAEFSDVPIDPVSERIEDYFLHFPIFTERLDIWRWFDKHHSKGVAYLLYGECSE